jgi:peptide/nickel transport system substrate-binding protein
MRVRKRSILVAVSVLSAAATVLSACGGSSSRGGTTASQDLVWVWNFAPTAGWQLETDNASYLTQAGVAEPLVRVDTTGRLSPGLATSWTQTAPTTWQFTLRTGVKFQNGDPFDAAAAAFSINYILHVKVPGPALSPTDITKVVAQGTNVLVVTTAAPNALVPQEFAAAGGSIMARQAYLANGNIDPVGTGTGPFIMTSQNLPQSISLKANPTYWGGHVALSSAKILYVSNGQTRLSLVTAGQAQLASTIPAPQLSTISSNPSLTTTSHEAPRFSGLYLNNKKAPFNNVDVRQAIQSALNLSQIAQTVGGAQPAAGPFNTADPWAPRGASVPTYDLNRAKQLLAQSGVNPSTLKFTLLAYSDRPDLPVAATVIQSMLGQIGIKVSIKVGTYNALEPSMLNGTYDMAMVSRGYVFDTPDPLSFLTSDYTCKGTYNVSQYCNPTVDAEMARAAKVTDATQRYALYAQVASTLQNDAVDIFLYHVVQSDVHTKSLKNFVLYASTEYYLTKDLSLAG